MGNIKWKAQFGRTENYAGIAANSAGKDNTADYAAIGLDYSLSKQTTLGGYIASLEGGAIIWKWIRSSADHIQKIFLE